jgi:hypothetical protein
MEGKIKLFKEAVLLKILLIRLIVQLVWAKHCSLMLMKELKESYGNLLI